jgi:hypothetical protein
MLPLIARMLAQQHLQQPQELEEALTSAMRWQDRQLGGTTPGVLKILTAKDSLAAEPTSKLRVRKRVVGGSSWLRIPNDAHQGSP